MHPNCSGELIKTCLGYPSDMLGLGPTLPEAVFLLEIGGVGGCRGVGESGSPGPLGFGAGIIFFIKGGCSVRLCSSRSCH